MFNDVFKMNFKKFDNWERESLRLFRKQDLDILLDNFVVEQEQEDFLHNLADMLFRLNENLTKHNSRTKKYCYHCIYPTLYLKYVNKTINESKKILQNGTKNDY